MIKQRLADKRKERNLTQEEFALRLGMETSNYSRRESGMTKISKKKWEKMAKELDVALEEIYEPDEAIYIINNQEASGNYSGSQNHFHQMPEHILETMRKYIDKLEQENQSLKQQLLEKK